MERLQVSATNACLFSKILPAGAEPVMDQPLRSIQIEVGYPDPVDPLAEDGSPNLLFRSTGVRSEPGRDPDPDSPAGLALWTPETANDVLNFTLEKLDAPLPGWDVDEVMIRATFVYNPSDPRVDLSGGGSTHVKEERTRDLNPVISDDGLTHLYVKFSLAPHIPNDSVTVTLTCSAGTRRDTLTVTSASQKHVVWEVITDKLDEVNSFEYEVDLTVAGPGLTDAPMRWVGPTVRVDLPEGRIKSISPLKVVVPPPPMDLVEKVNAYITAFHS